MDVVLVRNFGVQSILLTRVKGHYKFGLQLALVEAVI